jgi:hypothetical protein
MYVRKRCPCQSERKTNLFLVENPRQPFIAADRHGAENRDRNAKAALAQLAILDLRGRHSSNSVVRMERNDFRPSIYTCGSQDGVAKKILQQNTTDGYLSILVPPAD